MFTAGMSAEKYNTVIVLVLRLNAHSKTVLRHGLAISHQNVTYIS